MTTHTDRIASLIHSAERVPDRIELALTALVDDPGALFESGVLADL